MSAPSGLASVGLFLLAPAVLCTLLFAYATSWFTMRSPSGADAMGLVTLYVLLMMAWAATVVAALLAAARGAFDWISASRGISSTTVAATAVGLALLSHFASLASMDARFPARTLCGLAGGLALPLATQTFLAVLLAAPALPARGWARTASFPFAALAGAGFAIALVLWVASEAERGRNIAAALEHSRKEDAARAAAEVQRTAKENAELDAMPDDAPLERFLTHLFIDKTDAHVAYAAKRIRKLPHLTERIEERLANPLPIQREYTLYFIGMAENPDPAWLPSMRKAILLLAADYGREGRGEAQGLITHTKGLTLGLLKALARFPASASTPN